MARIVVIDASPLIGLAIVDGLAWLPALFGTVFLPESVKQEVLPGKSARGEHAIVQALKAKGYSKRSVPKIRAVRYTETKTSPAPW